jgi:hypothetical protein
MTATRVQITKDGVKPPQESAVIASGGPRRPGTGQRGKGPRRGGLSTLHVNYCQNPASALLHPECACREIRAVS